MSTHDEHEHEEEDTYKVSDKGIKKVDALMDLDKNDDSLTKWKESLLGKGLSEDVARKYFRSTFVHGCFSIWTSFQINNN